MAPYIKSKMSEINIGKMHYIFAKFTVREIKWKSAFYVSVSTALSEKLFIITPWPNKPVTGSLPT